METRTVLISGAGIAGSTLAYWLHRHGFAVTVVERAPRLREGGYNIDIRGTALEVVRRMGLLDEVRRYATDMLGSTIVDEEGHEKAVMSAELFSMHEEDDVELMRGDLAKILYDATKNDVEYLFGDTITALRQDGDGVDVTFEAAPSRRFDLLVGADGLHSRVRELAFGPEENFRRDLGCQVAIGTVPNYLNLDRWEVTYPMAGRVALVYRARQADEARAMFLFKSEGSLSEAFAGAGWEVPRLLDSVREAPDFYVDTVSQIHCENWAKGRVVLLGDAACAPSLASGQGTSVALVGAYVLAGELKAAAGHTKAFAGYEAQLRKFADLNQQLGPKQLKGMIQHSRAQLWFQLKMLRLMPKMPGKDKMVARITEPMREAANAVALQDY
ncbi:FAD-dependent monooxygenase [Amycolatopsis taiwanensis]|uniref:FAD-dependent monooxygenase n=1 Tax=Amycolatopsis taiwanensis TaxID=342230 RepID=UPI000487F556|nr:FAD-dependent monooxygenase [Amycolatopsis taiwanensis]